MKKLEHVKEKRNLITACNTRGYVVRRIHEWDDNEFGKTNIVTIETSEYRITFVTNVLHGVNFFQIFSIYNTYQEREYKARRYHWKFVPLISGINSETNKLNQE